MMGGGLARWAVLEAAHGDFVLKTHNLPRIDPETGFIKTTELIEVCATDGH
jgi:hypothetical protein